MQGDKTVKKKLQPIKSKAFFLLAKKAYFTKELERKLREKGYPSQEIFSLLQEFTERGWLNDKDLALRYIKRQEALGYGPRVIALKLREKAGPILIPLNETQEVARNVIERKYKRDLPHKKNKVIAALLRRGFSYDLIKTLLEDIEKECDFSKSSSLS
jgi:regulatory protein